MSLHDRKFPIIRSPTACVMTQIAHLNVHFLLPSSSLCHCSVLPFALLWLDGRISLCV